jgi:transcriptional regulator with XRE-family HTH domain
MTDTSSEQIAADLASSIGRRVAEARRKLGLSQDQLATLSGASKGTIVQIEQGNANPSITSICRLAVALQVSVEELVSEPPVTSVRFNLADKPKVLWRGPKGGSASLLIGARGPNMLELWQWRLARGERYSSPGHSPGTREIVHVEKGSIAIEIADVARNMVAGVAGVFEADQPHAYVGNGPGVAHFTMVVEEPALQRRR